MKRFFYVITFLLVQLFLMSCNDGITPEEYTISILIDRTDPDGYLPSEEFILGALPKIDLTDGLELSVTNIGDTHYNDRQSFLLEKGETGWMANEDQRRKQFKLLKKQFAGALSKFNSQEYDYDRSDIFRSLAKELDRLSIQKGNREIWLFSDLKEHSFFSVYKPSDLYRLSKYPQKVVTEFNASTGLPQDLSGITLVIIYQPTIEDAELFSSLVRLYRKILEPKGVTIKVGIQNQKRL